MTRDKGTESRRVERAGDATASSGKDAPKTSAELLNDQAEGLEALARIAPVLRLFGHRGRRAADALSEARGVAGQVKELTSLPGRFNRVLGPRGWIAYERMDHNLLRDATNLAEAGRIEEAEGLLFDALDEDSLRSQLDSMVAVAAYRPRADLLRLAAEDFHAGRYHAVVPVVLAQIDGIVADVAGRALFHKTKGILPKLVAWDSISAQEGGLPDLVALLAEPRAKTTVGPIDVPYRHGILHGRDLGYASRTVAVKAWAALFSLREWAIKYERGETTPPPVEPAPSLRDTLEQLANTERQRRQIEAWQPRAEVPLPSHGIEPAAGSPEEAAEAWLQAWQERDFVAMASWTQVTRQLRQAQLASALEAMFGFCEVADFQIVGIADAAAALTEVTAELTVEGDEPGLRLTLNVILEDDEGHPVVRGTGPGRWGVNDISALRQQPISDTQDDQEQA